MAQGESKLSRNIMKALEAEGAFCWKTHGGSHMLAGLPDINCIYEGHYYGFETKMPKGKPSNIQLFIGEKIKKAGGTYLIIRSKAEALEAIGCGP